MDTINIGIVGCGEVVQIIHLPSLYHLGEQFRVTAVCDISANVVNAVADHWNVPTRYQDYRELVQQSNVDAVLVVNLYVYHVEVVVAAIAAGKHVLVEKPMCMTLDEADQIIAAQKQAQVTVQVGYMRRYASAFLQACQMVQEMDEICLARVHDVIGRNALIIEQTARVVRGKDIPQSVKQEGRRLQQARVLTAIGDDAPLSLQRAYLLLLGLSTHDVSAMRELLGMPRGVLHAIWRESLQKSDTPEKVAGRYLSAAFDYGSFVCHFSTGIDEIARYDTNIEVYGTDRMIRVQYDTPYVRNMPVRLMVTHSPNATDVTTSTVHPGWTDPFVAEWQAFYSNVMEQRPPKTDPQDFRQDLTLFQTIIRLLQTRDAAE